MEQETMMKEILQALKLHSNQMEQRFDKIDEGFGEIGKRLDAIDERLDRMEQKMDGFRVELTETQETVDFTSSKILQHDKKLRKLLHQ